MTIWIDRPAWPAHGRLWSHLISDTSYAEVHAFAAANGIPRRGFEGDHYDVPEQAYAALVAAGARPTTSAHILELLAGSRLRLRKRRGEKGIARALDIVFPDGSIADIDMVASSMGPPEAATFASAVLIREAGGRYLVGFSRRRQEWSAPGGWREPGETPVETAVRETREETGIVLDPGTLRPVAYERFHRHEGSPWPVPGGRFLAVFRCELRESAPTLTAPDGEPAEWVAPEEMLVRYAHSWWRPLVSHLLAHP
ncbi:MAG: DUF4031 domain-containing protein [Lysobacter sp.]|nr:DUF4031 domain-containing protein [Lysobacter sp.]